VILRNLSIISVLLVPAAKLHEVQRVSFSVRVDAIVS